MFLKGYMAKRILLEIQKKIVFIGETAYFPLPVDWLTMLERNNLATAYDKEKHSTNTRLVQNKAGQIFFEGWLIIDPSWTAKMRENAEKEKQEE